MEILRFFVIKKRLVIFFALANGLIFIGLTLFMFFLKDLKKFPELNYKINRATILMDVFGFSMTDDGAVVVGIKLAILTHQPSLLFRQQATTSSRPCSASTPSSAFWAWLAHA